MNKKIKFLLTVLLLLLTFEPINPTQDLKSASGGVELSDDGSETIPAPAPEPSPAPAPEPEPVQEPVPELIPEPTPQPEPVVVSEPVQESVPIPQPEPTLVEEVIVESGTGEVTESVQVESGSGEIIQEVNIESGTGEVVEEVLVPQETLETYMAKGEKPLSCLDLLSKIKDTNEQPKIIDWFTGDSKWESFKESIKVASEYISTNIFALFLKIKTKNS